MTEGTATAKVEAWVVIAGARKGNGLCVLFPDCVRKKDRNKTTLVCSGFYMFLSSLFLVNHIYIYILFMTMETIST